MKKNESKLPALKIQIDEEIAKQDQSLNKHLLKLQGFTKLVNNPVEKEKLENHPFARGKNGKPVQYLPISFIEMMLDEIYFGLWNTKNFQWTNVANEIIAKIEVEVFHPIGQAWIVRTGVAGKKIMTDEIPEALKKSMTKQEQNQWALNLDNKKPMALEMGGFATLKADCFKNACISLGKAFGRDVNRDHTAEYEPMVQAMKKKIDEYRKRVEVLLDGWDDSEDKSDIIGRIVEAESRGLNTPEFYVGIIKELER